MGEKARHFFSKEEQEKIRQAIVEAESRSSGEIVPMVVEESDHYREAMFLGAFVLASFSALIAAILLKHETIWFYLPAFCLFLPPCWILVKMLPFLKMLFVNRKRAEHAVRERAVRAFYEKGLYRTKYDTGVLIFISLLERKVWILGGRGINEKLSKKSWQGLASELSKGLKENRATETLCAVIEKCGTSLSEHFPHLADDANELPDKVMS